MVNDLANDGPHPHLVAVEVVLVCERLDVGHDEVTISVIEGWQTGVKLAE